MSFSGDVQAFRANVRDRSLALHEAVCDRAFTSIVEGSPLTGAPGQPVEGPGPLKASWQEESPAPLVRIIATDVPYAPDVEDGTRNGRAMALESSVGGFHSVALTVAGWDKIVADATAEVAGAAA